MVLYHIRLVFAFFAILSLGTFELEQFVVRSHSDRNPNVAFQGVDRAGSGVQDWITQTPAPVNFGGLQNTGPALPVPVVRDRIVASDPWWLAVTRAGLPYSLFSRPPPASSPSPLRHRGNAWFI